MRNNLIGFSAGKGFGLENASSGWTIENNEIGGNGLLNFPVLETAQIVGGNLILKGFARPGAALEFFVAAPDASGFGGGQTYLATLTEGAAQDTDATTGTYTSRFGGKTVGTDTTN